jgi:ATP-binding protein involved in chromosome partitioning
LHASEPAPVLQDLGEVRERVAARLADVDVLVAVASGKGGVGKSAVAANLALALAGGPEAVGLLDADLHSPTLARMLGLSGSPVRVRDALLQPVEGPRGLRVQGMDFFLQGADALAFEGATGEGIPLRSLLEDAALADLLAETNWGALSTLVVDLPPGPDRLPALARLVPQRLVALAVTIPTEVSLLAVERSLRRARDARIPVLGLVENMGSAVCRRCGNVAPLFREAAVEGKARELDLEIVARIPFDPELAAAADAGRAFLDGPGAGGPAGQAFVSLSERVRGLDPTRLEEVW